MTVLSSVFNLWKQFVPRSGREVIKLFACSTQLSMKFQLLIKTKVATSNAVSCFKSLRCCIFKMPIIVGILTFMSRIHFVLSRVKYENSFITSGPGLKKQLGRAWNRFGLFGSSDGILEVVNFYENKNADDKKSMQNDCMLRWKLGSVYSAGCQ